MLVPQPAIFLDRDGTLMKEVHYCRRPKDVEVFPGVTEALQTFREKGYLVVVVSNQSGIGRGLITNLEYRAVEAEFLRQVGPGLVDGTYFCPDLPGSGSINRKPAPGMLLQAAQELNIDLKNSWMVGDKASDIAAGRNAGTRTVLVQTGYGLEQIDTKADIVVPDVPAAATAILSYTPSRSCLPAA